MLCNLGCTPHIPKLLFECDSLMNNSEVQYKFLSHRHRIRRGNRHIGDLQIYIRNLRRNLCMLPQVRCLGLFSCFEMHSQDHCHLVAKFYSFHLVMFRAKQILGHHSNRILGRNISRCFDTQETKTSKYGH